MKIYTKGSYSLRRLLPIEWAVYKKIRIDAVQRDPHVFGAHFDAEFDYTDDQWQSFLEDPFHVYFGLFYEDDIVGVTGISIDPKDDRHAILTSSFINLHHRGKGLAMLFYEARLDWARSKKLRAVTVSHRISNTVSKAANQRFGFKFTHAESRIWPDGVEADEHHYILEL